MNISLLTPRLIEIQSLLFPSKIFMKYLFDTCLSKNKFHRKHEGVGEGALNYEVK
jgi:hypothetical protein